MQARLMTRAEPPDPAEVERAAPTHGNASPPIAR
jgi:hypothetical protein